MVVEREECGCYDGVWIRLQRRAGVLVRPLPRLFLFRRAQVRLDAGFQVSAGCAVSVRPGWSCPPGKASGWVDPDAVRTALRPDTWLVSIMQVNNETGVCQPLAAIADGVESHPAWFHTDAA